MPELQGRSQHEDELAALLLLLFRRYESRPVDAAFEFEMSRALAEKLAATFLLAALMMAEDESLALGRNSVAAQASSWAQGYAQAQAAKLAEAVRAGDVKLSEGLARTIAVTETTTAVTRGEQVTVSAVEEATGDRLEPFWRTALDAKVCPVCSPLNNQPRDVWQDEYPAGPPAHANCRCYLVYDRLIDGLRSN